MFLNGACVMACVPRKEDPKQSFCFKDVYWDRIQKVGDLSLDRPRPRCIEAYVFLPRSR